MLSCHVTHVPLLSKAPATSWCANTDASFECMSSFDTVVIRHWHITCKYSRTCTLPTIKTCKCSGIVMYYSCNDWVCRDVRIHDLWHAAMWGVLTETSQSRRITCCLSRARTSHWVLQCNSLWCTVTCTPIQSRHSSCWEFHHDYTNQARVTHTHSSSRTSSWSENHH